MVIGISYPSVDESDRDRELSDDESTDDDVDDDCMLNDCLYIFIMSPLKLLFITKVICSIFIYSEQKIQLHNCSSSSRVSNMQSEKLKDTSDFVAH